MEEQKFLEKITFVGVTTKDRVTFNSCEPKLILKDIVKIDYDVVKLKVQTDIKQKLRPIKIVEIVYG